MIYQFIMIIKKKYYKITISDYGKNLIHNEFMGLNFFNKLRYEKKIFFLNSTKKKIIED